MENKKNKDISFENLYVPRLSEDKCRRIHEACLEILECVGVRLYLEEAVDLLKKAGAKVSDENLVCVPRRLVERALSSAPKRVMLYDRDGHSVLPVEGYNCFYGPGSDCLKIIDHRSGKRRDPLLKDIAEGATLCDSLTHMDFVMSMVLPSDVNTAIADRYQMEAMLSCTTKPIIYVTYELEGCQDAVEMAEAVVGSAETLQRKPIAACYINAVSGIRHNREALEKLLYLASKNLPSLYIPSSTSGVTSPVTPAGAVALDYAGVLVGLVLSQLKREGAPVIIPGFPPTPLDMRTLVSTYCEPERGIMQAMAHYYGLPMFSIGGASESKTVDSQAAAEAALSLLVETSAGGNLIHDLGYLELGNAFSFVQLVICDEVVDWIKAYAREFEVNDETLALDVIAQVGPDHQFLDTEHTLEHYRDRWYPRLFERETYESWQKKGGKELETRAAEKVDQVLADHKPEPLPAKIKERLRMIIERTRNKE